MYDEIGFWDIITGLPFAVFVIYYLMGCIWAFINWIFLDNWE